MTRMTAKQFREQNEAPKRNKFNAKKTVADGIYFDSAKEAKRWIYLRQLEKAGEISHLERQPKFKLMNGDRPVLIRSERYKNGRQAIYTADFSYWRDECRVVEDVKSAATRTEAYCLRKAYVEAQFPAVRIVEV